MSNEITLQDIANNLEAASMEELYVLADKLNQYVDQHKIELRQEDWYWMLLFMDMIEEEAKRRPIEPLWRKAKRFAKRHGGEIGKIAAAVGIGVFLGISLDD